MNINSKNTYSVFASYYDLYVRNFNDDLNLLLDLCRNSNRIIEIGCGTGRVLAFLLENKLEVTGVDISDEMLDIAQEKLSVYLNQKKVSLHNFDFSSKPFGDKLDCALITFYTFNYIVHEPEMFLQNVYNSLLPGGTIVLDLFVPSSLGISEKQAQWKQFSFKTGGREITVKDKRYMKGDIERRSQVFIENNCEHRIETERRFFTPEAIKTLLLNTGFTQVEFCENYTGFFKAGITKIGGLSNFVVRGRKRL